MIILFTLMESKTAVAEIQSKHGLQFVATPVSDSNGNKYNRQQEMIRCRPEYQKINLLPNTLETKEFSLAAETQSTRTQYLMVNYQTLNQQKEQMKR